MKSNPYFNYTSLYKEFIILNVIEKNNQITQRDLAELIESSVSLVNSYLDKYESESLIKKIYISKKNIKYKITKKGIERKKFLNIGYLKYSHMLYDYARENITEFLKQLEKKDKLNLYLYGAGEVSEILLNAIYSKSDTKLNILGIIDDDKNKVGNYIFNIPIVSLEQVDINKHDGILISSYSNKSNIMIKLRKKNYDKHKIYNFFEL